MPRQEQPDAFCNGETCRSIARVLLPGDGGQWCFRHADEARVAYLARVEERRAAMAAAAPPPPACSTCGAAEARPYPAGWRCAGCAEVLRVRVLASMGKGAGRPLRRVRA